MDSGVSGYDDDELRRYCRSTSAHNVLEIDGQDQCDVWSRFRMGRRGRPSALETGESDGFHWARAAHDGYRRLGVPSVARWIGCRPGGPYFIVDSANGSGVHRLVNRLHLHPDAQVSVTDGRAQVTIGPHSVFIAPLPPTFTFTFTLSRGWHCPEFGRRQACPVLEWRASGGLPLVCGWCISPGIPLENPRVVADSTAGFRLGWDDQRVPGSSGPSRWRTREICGFAQSGSI